VVPPVCPTPSSSLTVMVDAWLFALGATKPSPRTLAAYRSDLEGVARRIDPAGLAGLRLEDLDKSSLRSGFASWAADHAASSVLRAHSAWTSLFDYLVAEDLAEGNPMAAVPKPRPRTSSPKAIQADDAATRLLSTAAQPDTTARHPWPERDLALIATFLVTGIRTGEAEALGMASVAGLQGSPVAISTSHDDGANSGSDRQSRTP
jgi:integrase/recombinase XerD